MSKNPREPKHVKALIRQAEKRLINTPPVIPVATLWSRLKLRRSSGRRADDR